MPTPPQATRADRAESGRRASHTHGGRSRLTDSRLLVLCYVMLVCWCSCYVMLCNFIAQGDAHAAGESPVPSCTMPSPHRVHASPDSDARMSALRPYTYHWSLPMSSASMGYGRVGATMAPGDPNPPLTSRPPHPVHQPRPTNRPWSHLSSPCAKPADTPCSRGRTPAGVNRWCEMPYGGRARTIATQVNPHPRTPPLGHAFMRN